MIRCQCRSEERRLPSALVTDTSMDRVDNSMSWLLAKSAEGHSTDASGPGPYRARHELEEEKRAEQRRLELAVQRSELNPPDVRIRAWEKVLLALTSGG